jgi:hypothetical protein
MAKVDIEDGWLTVRVTWLERWLLSEKPRRCPLSIVQSVNPHPALLDMLLYWTDQRGVWLYGATTHEGYLVPSTRNPYATLAIQIFGERPWYVELDDQEPVEVAAEIERAIEATGRRAAPRSAEVVDLAFARVAHQRAASPNGSQPEGHSVIERREAVSAVHDLAMLQQRAAPESAAAPVPREAASMAEKPEWTGSLRTSRDRDLWRIGGWLIGAGAAGVLAGAFIAAAGASPGLMIVGAGLACAVIGGLTLGLVAHHHG